VSEPTILLWFFFPGLWLLIIPGLVLANPGKQKWGEAGMGQVSMKRFGRHAIPR